MDRNFKGRFMKAKGSELIPVLTIAGSDLVVEQGYKPILKPLVHTIFLV